MGKLEDEIENWEDEFKRSNIVKCYQEISHYWWVHCYDKINEFVLENVKLSKKSSILEAGCGTGNSTLLLANKVKKIYLLDIANNALKVCRILAKHYGVKNAIYTQGNILKLPFRREQFHFTWNVGVIEHYDDEEIIQIISEMMRVTYSNGMVCIGIPNMYSGPILRALFLSNPYLKIITSKINGYRLDTERFFKIQHLIKLINKAGEMSNVRIKELKISYVGSPLPVETNKHIFTLINNIASKILKKNAFLIMVTFRILR